MHKSLLVIGDLGRIPAEPRDKPTTQKNAAEVHAHLTANASYEASLNHKQEDRSPDTASALLVSASKELRTLAARYALAGYELIDEVDIDGARRLYAVHDGKTQHLDSIIAARAHLAQIADHQ